jgi:hypothetical protein
MEMVAQGQENIQVAVRIRPARADLGSSKSGLKAPGSSNDSVKILAAPDNKSQASAYAILWNYFAALCLSKYRTRKISHIDCTVLRQIIAPVQLPKLTREWEGTFDHAFPPDATQVTFDVCAQLGCSLGGWVDPWVVVSLVVKPIGRDTPRPGASAALLHRHIRVS